MIVKYRGSFGDWTLEEADKITYSQLSIVEVREIVQRTPEYQDAKDSDQAHRILFSRIVDYIREETGAPEDMTFHGIIDTKGGSKFNVVILDNNRARVFDYSAAVYILNSAGKTIEKL